MFAINSCSFTQKTKKLKQIQSKIHKPRTIQKILVDEERDSWVLQESRKIPKKVSLVILYSN